MNTKEMFTGGREFPVTITREDNGARFTIRDVSTFLDRSQLRKLSEYLDMENVPPYVGLGYPLSVRVYQEDDGTTWVRVFHVDERSGRLSCLSDDETGELYSWLDSWLDKP